MSGQVRPFVPQDYEALAQITNTVFPEHPYSAAELASEDDQFNIDTRLRWGRFMAEVDGTPVGFAQFSQNPGMYHPQRFVLTGGVLPSWRDQGLGSALYERVCAATRLFDPLSLRTSAREDSTAVGFLRNRAFRETQRTWEAVIDPRSLDFSALGKLHGRLRAQGIQITSALELQHQNPCWRALLHDAFCEARLDVPRSEPATPISYEQFVAWILEDPGFVAQAYFVAMHGGQAIGISDLYRSEASDGLFTGFTGVRRAYRGCGVAMALKLHALQRAAEWGVPWVRTDNASTNQGMLAINEKLGFCKEPAWLSMVHEIAAGACSTGAK